MRILVLLLAAISTFGADPKLTPEMQSVISHISAASLRGHLSFLASDLLEGRATPSPGLDLAAEYIAAQFRRAGLEAVGGDGYFQPATVSVREPNWDRFRMTVSADGNSLEAAKNDVYLLPDSPLDLNNAPIVVVDTGTEITSDLVNGKVVYVTNPRAAARVRNFQPALVLSSGRDLPTGPQVRDPESNRRTTSTGVILRQDIAELIAHGKSPRLTLHMEAPLTHSARVNNVVGLLRGSDPILRDTYVMLTAHYDHLGTRASGDHRIYNGANDDGSGTVSVIEIAAALAAMEPRPRRSILFVAFYGEERGLLGSRYYGRHPVVPLEKTIADLNLEQIGRTDASNGKQIKTASLTGFDFSDLPRIVAEAGRLTGVKIYKDDSASDAYFSRSDNQALADVGVPAHTLCVAFDYSDYHGAGDHWEKIDYTNMAKIDDTVALALLHLASEAPPPGWNESSPPAKRYVDAAKKLHQLNAIN